MHLYKFAVLDIKKVYLSIKKALLKKALNLAKAYTAISAEDKSIIHHGRKSLLFRNKGTLIKK